MVINKGMHFDLLQNNGMMCVLIKIMETEVKVTQI